MNNLKVPELREIARSRGLKGWYRLRKSDLISSIISEEQRQREEEELERQRQYEPEKEQGSQHKPEKSQHELEEERKERLRAKRRAKKARFRANRRVRREKKAEQEKKEEERLRAKPQTRFIITRKEWAERQQMLEKSLSMEITNDFMLRYLSCLRG